MMRRGYSYSLGVTNSGQLDMGLLFVCYQHDLEKGFLTVQKRLNGEALEEYVKPIGGGYFFALPGVKTQTIIWDSLCSKPDDYAPQGGVFLTS
jgi:deferrochelatase/peroxidase EfeB